MEILIYIICALVIIALVALFLISLAFLGYIARREQFALFKGSVKKTANKIDDGEKYDQYGEGYAKKIANLKMLPCEKIVVENSRKQKLVGRLYQTKENNDVVVLACHGARSTGVEEFSFWAEYYRKRGLDYFLIDHVACGESEGKYMGFGSLESVDTAIWLTEIKSRYGEKVKILLHGISMGGATALMMSAMKSLPNVVGIVSESSYTSCYEEFSYQLKNAFHLPCFPFIPCLNFVGKIFAGYSFKKTSPIEAVKKATLPILFIHGDADDFVPTYMANKLFEECKSDKQLVIIEGAIHARSYQKDSAKCEEAFDNFLKKVIK